MARADKAETTMLFHDAKGKNQMKTVDGKDGVVTILRCMMQRAKLQKVNFEETEVYR